MARLSVIIITKNEEANIRACLDSVSWADEVILVDDESSDGTLYIAASYPNVRVFRRPMAGGFGPQKQFALEQAGGPWILSLDADERITERAQREIIAKIKSSEYDGFCFRRKSPVLGRFINDRKPRNLRLFRRDKGRFNRRRVHEAVEVQGRLGIMKETILHYSNNTRNITNFMKAANAYSTLSAQDLYERGRRLTPLTCPLYLLAYPAYLFLRLYIMQGHWRDGRSGFVSAFFRALEGCFSLIKLWELQRQKPWQGSLRE